jgi:hypothetical protein
MNQDPIEVQGIVQADGTLVLDRRLELPAGPVRVTVQPVVASEAPNLSRFQAMMAQIWAGQKARGHVPRTKEEIDSETRQMREEAEEELQAAERLHEECQNARQGRKE